MDFILQNAFEKQQKFDEELAESVNQANIKIIGCGGAGINTTHWLYQMGVKGGEIIAVNTDIQHLKDRDADKKILVGRQLTRGLGAGGHPEVGKQAMEESQHEVREILKGADMVFLCAGLGGGSGTGGVGVLAKMAKDMGSIVIGVVTMPFKIERARIDKAEWGLKELRQYSDTVIVIDNNRLVELAGNLPINQAFAVANELISTMIKSIVETISVPSLVNLDFADVKAIMTGGGLSAMGVGESDSDHRVEEAVKRALTQPLIEVNYEGALGALIHMTGGEDMTLDEVNRAGELITESLDQDANVIWGARVDPEMKGKFRIMTIITGVKSAYIVGPANYDKTNMRGMGSSANLASDDEGLGIEMIH